MPKVCRTAEEFAKAMKDEEDEFFVEGDLAKKIIRIKATGKVAWFACAGSIAIAIMVYLATPAASVVGTPAAGVAAFLAGNAVAAPAAATLGTAVVPAVAIGVCAGGVGVLNTLRDKYTIVEKTEKRIKLKRKGK